MSSLSFRGRWFSVALAMGVVWACSGEERTFIDTDPASAGDGGTGGTTGGSGGKSGSGATSGLGSGGDSGSGGSSAGGAGEAGQAGDGGSSSGQGGSGQGGSGNRGGSSGSSGNGGAGEAGDAGQGGEGGTVIVPPDPGRPGTALVSGGIWMKSTNFQLFSTMGQNAFPVNAASPNFQLHGGVVGTTQP